MCSLEGAPLCRILSIAAWVLFEGYLEVSCVCVFFFFFLIIYLAALGLSLSMWDLQSSL